MARKKLSTVSGTRHSEQNVQNWSFDDEFGLFMVEGLAYNPNTDTMDLITVERKYEYMGKQTVGNYTYYGFKERGTTAWKVMRKDNTDDSAWAYCYSEAGAITWSTAWAAPADAGMVYGNPPDS